MLDKKFILDNAELVQANCDARGVQADLSLMILVI